MALQNQYVTETRVPLGAIPMDGEVLLVAGIEMTDTCHIA